MIGNLAFLIIIILFVSRRGGLDYLSQKFSPQKNVIKQLPVQERSFFYDLLTDIYKELPEENNEIIFMGDSHFQLIPWNEFLMSDRIKNRGIGGDNLKGLIDRVDSEISKKSALIFICAGINDINENKSSEFILAQFDSLVTKISLKTNARIKILTILPLGKKYYDSQLKNKKIKIINDALSSLENGKKFDIINIYKHFTNSQNYLKDEYSYDNIHLNALGYQKLKKILMENF